MKTEHSFFTLCRPHGFLRTALCVLMHMYIYNKKNGRLTPAPSVLLSAGPVVRAKMYFHMTDGCVGLQQEAWLHCFTISLETRTEYPHYGAVSAFCVMDASLRVVGTSTRRREGVP